MHHTIKYSSDTLYESIHSTTFDTLDSFYITVPKETFIADKFKISYYIDDIYVCILNERQVFKSISVLFHAAPINCRLSVITFKGEQDKDIARVGVDLVGNILTVVSSGEVANNEFGSKDYFSFELTDSDEISNQNLKLEATVDGNQDAVNFKDTLNGVSFKYDNILTRCAS